jgi:hemin uptake protein HemP
MNAEKAHPGCDEGGALAPGPARATRVFDSRELFGEAREIRIVHNGESYQLRQTRLGKLILTK